MIVDDMLKVSMVLVIGITINYCSSYILPEEPLASKPAQILLFDLDRIENSSINETNIVLNIPVFRLGSGIR